MNNEHRFCLEQEMHNALGETAGCVVSVPSDTSSVRVGPFLAIVDNF